MKYNSDRRRIAAISFLSNISLDGPHFISKIPEKHKITRFRSSKEDDIDNSQILVDITKTIDDDFNLVPSLNLFSRSNKELKLTEQTSQKFNKPSHINNEEHTSSFNDDIRTHSKTIFVLKNVPIITTSIIPFSSSRKNSLLPEPSQNNDNSPENATSNLIFLPIVPPTGNQELSLVHMLSQKFSHPTNLTSKSLVRRRLPTTNQSEFNHIYPKIKNRTRNPSNWSVMSGNSEFSSFYPARTSSGSQSPQNQKSCITPPIPQTAPPIDNYNDSPFTLELNKKKHQPSPPLSQTFNSLVAPHLVGNCHTSHLHTQNYRTHSKTCHFFQTGYQGRCAFGVHNKNILDLTQESSIKLIADPLLFYNPYLLDDPRRLIAIEKRLLNLPYYLTSVLVYTKPAEQKRNINRKFHEMFPAIQLTLTKLRSLKTQMYQVIQKFYVTRLNRKCASATCLLISGKLNDLKGAEMNNFFLELQSQFRINARELLHSELAVSLALEFNLIPSDAEIVPHLQRLLSLFENF